MSYIKNCVKLDVGTIEEKRNEIRKQFLQTYELDEKLFDLLKDKKYLYEQPNKLRHPLIFYFGHTASFYINKLILANIIKHRVNPLFESIFAIGVDEMSWDDLNSKNYTWPTPQETQAYRDEVKNIVLNIIDTIEFSIPINWDSPMWIILMGIEHENIHIETSSVLLRELDIKFLKDEETFIYKNEGENAYPINELLDVKGSNIILQKDRQNPIYYGWDNEFSSHEAVIKDFQASKYLVSNGEFLEFVKENGYERSELFSTEGKNWLSYTKTKCPHFWIKKGEDFYLREINREIPLPLNYPVDVNVYEAEAFCAYKSLKLGFEVRLPSEDEYYALYEYTNANKKEANIGLIQFNQSSVDKYKFDDFFDVVGNVWQWSITPTYPFDDFVTHPIYDDFTTPTFDDRHALIKGGSFISLGNETLKEARYAFRKHFFQHAGFRYVKSSNEYKTKLNDNVYETDELISSYCQTHYGNKNSEITTIVEILKPYFKDINRRKALDLGCLVGRASFELAKDFDEVIGIDFSANLINIGVKLKLYDTLIYKGEKLNDIFEEKRVSLKDLDLDDIKEKVSFMQGDASNLKDIYKDFDLIFCSNLLERVSNPLKVLDGIQNRLNKDGLLIFITPTTYKEENMKEKLNSFDLVELVNLSSSTQINIWKKKS
jgi:5-histidylcysteine sulfoxide synthase/putative 4-mercaptohistidine N1-methyltranferase